MKKDFWQEKEVTRKRTRIIQVNLGNLCNLECAHCHIEASPKGKNNMDKKTSDKVIKKIISLKSITTVELTGGAPELNPNFTSFIEQLSKNGKELVVHTNLTVLKGKKYSKIMDLYKKHNVKLVASLPSVFEDETEKQRGKFVFDNSLTIIKRLNELGYGDADNKLELLLVHNPQGMELPKPQLELEVKYKNILKKDYNLNFNKLLTITNSPIKRFKQELVKNNNLENYIDILKRNYNSATVENVMCRDLISIDYQGYMYDCDFNQALDMKIDKLAKKKFWELELEDIENKQIKFSDHCYACTASQGSSCSGILVGSKTSGKESSIMDKNNSVKINVQQYYGKEIQSTDDLKTSACCTADETPDHVKEALKYIVDEIMIKYYGCGSPVPPSVEGCKILDLGCGTGRDSFVLSYLAGEKGHVYGIDMTKEQIDVAKKYQKDQTKRFGFKKPNTTFIHDYIETIDTHFKKESMDIVISNCVMNLVEDKEAVFRKAFKLLKNGGEFYFSDVYTDRRVPDSVKKDPVIYGECLGGALYINDFIRMAKRAGFEEPRVVTNREIILEEKDIIKLTGNIKFYSTTYRLWKIKGLEDKCEDFGQVAVYKGGIEESPDKFELDSDHSFEKGRAERVCGNTASMLSDTRYSKYFEIIGNTDTHYGEFTGCCTIVKGLERDEASNETGVSSSCGC